MLRHGDLSVVLLYPESATLADQEWLSVEFRNAGSEKIEIADASYRMDMEIWAADELRMTGNLASGNTYALFPHCWEVTPVAPRYVEPGIYTVSQHPSRYSSALLPIPSDHAFKVKANIHFRLTLADGTHISTPREGFPFSFRWEKPDAKGLATIEEEILAMLENPEPKSASVHSYRLNALLKSVTPPSLFRSPPPRHRYPPRRRMVRKEADHPALSRHRR